MCGKEGGFGMESRCMGESRGVQGKYLPGGAGTWLSVSRAQRQSSMRVRAAQKDMLTPRHKLRYVLKLFAGGSGPVGTTCTSSACFELLVLVSFCLSCVCQVSSCTSNANHELRALLAAVCVIHCWVALCLSGLLVFLCIPYRLLNKSTQNND